MESLLWAFNLIAVVILCYWAISEDDKDKSERFENKTNKKRKFTK